MPIRNDFTYEERLHLKALGRRLIGLREELGMKPVVFAMLKVSAIAFPYLWTTVRIQTFSLDKPRFEATSPRFRGLIPSICKPLWLF